MGGIENIVGKEKMLVTCNLSRTSLIPNLAEFIKHLIKSAMEYHITHMHAIT